MLNFVRYMVDLYGYHLSQLDRDLLLSRIQGSLKDSLQAITAEDPTSLQRYKQIYDSIESFAEEVFNIKNDDDETSTPNYMVLFNETATNILRSIQDIRKLRPGVQQVVFLISSHGYEVKWKRSIDGLEAAKCFGGFRTNPTSEHRDGQTVTLPQLIRSCHDQLLSQFYFVDTCRDHVDHTRTLSSVAEHQFDANKDELIVMYATSSNQRAWRYHRYGGLLIQKLIEVLTSTAADVVTSCDSNAWAGVMIQIVEQWTTRITDVDISPERLNNQRPKVYSNNYVYEMYEHAAEILDEIFRQQKLWYGDRSSTSIIPYGQHQTMQLQRKMHVCHQLERMYRSMAVAYRQYKSNQDQHSVIGVIDKLIEEFDNDPDMMQMLPDLNKYLTFIDEVSISFVRRENQRLQCKPLPRTPSEKRKQLEAGTKRPYHTGKNNNYQDPIENPTDQNDTNREALRRVFRRRLGNKQV